MNPPGRRGNRSARLPGVLLLILAALLVGCSGPGDRPGTVSSGSPAPSDSQEDSMPSPSTDRLWDAIATGDDAAGLAAIADGAELEARNDTGATPLIAATKAGRTELAIALLEAGDRKSTRLNSSH